MAGKSTAVFGIYRSLGQADESVNRLVKAGFDNDDISVLLLDNQITRDFALKNDTKTPEVTARGAATGGVIGGALGLLVAVGALAIPGVGPLVGVGPLLAALAAMGAGGVFGGLMGALIGMGIPEHKARRFEGRIKEGGILISVHCDTFEEIDRATNILKETGAEDIASSGEASADSATRS